MSIKTFQTQYKPFEFKDLRGKSGQIIYGLDEGKEEGDLTCELLVFYSDGKYYLIAEKFKELG